MKKLCAICLIIMTLLLCSCHAGTNDKGAAAPDVTGEFSVSVLKVGQADAIILQTENHCALIDCGEKDDGDEVSEFLAERGISNIDYLFITHFDKDHVGGVPEVLDNVTVGELIVPDCVGTNKEYERYLEALTTHDISPTTLTENMTFTLDDVLFEVYPPLRKAYAEGDNDFSLAISATHGDNRFLFAGDAEKLRIAEIINQTNGTYNFLKVPHHGKYNDYSKRFFETVKPEISVIACSDKNPESEKVVNALKSVGSSIYVTREGNVYAVSDGKTITITQ